MAQTDFSATSTAVKTYWTTKVMKAGRDASLLMSSGMIGSSGDMNRPIQLISELTADERGASAIINLIQDLQGDGQVDDDVMEGEEESLVNETLEIRLSQLRNAVKNKGKMSEQKTVLRFRQQVRDKLGYWWGDKVDELAFLTVAGIAYSLKLDGSPRAGSKLPRLAFNADITAPSANRKLYAGGVATSTATLTATDTMSWNDLVRARAFAERRRIKPLKMNGRDYYIVCLTPEAMKDLKLDDDYKTAVANAGARGEKNPLFTGMAADVDGLLLYSHNKVPNTRGTAATGKYGASGTVEGAQCLMLGAQALGFARIGEAEWNESDNRDYGNKYGVAYGQIIGMRKSIFNSIPDGSTLEDFGVVSLYCAADD